MKYINVNNEVYEIASDESRMLATHLVDLYKRLGLNPGISVSDMSPAVWRFVLRIVEIWKRFFPHEYIDWVAGMKYELEVERPIKQAIKGGSHSIVSYPMRVHQMMQVFLPKVRMQDKEFIKKFVGFIPEFKNTKYRI